jgi:copper homeostasis protein
VNVLLEVTVDSPAGLRAAAEGGADRVELCAALELGGLTPSPGALARCLEVEGALPVHVLVRPRPGGFVYDADELRTSLRDAEAAAAAGAAGVVVGALRDDGGRLALDGAFLAEAAQRARAASPLGAALQVVLHRAVDQLPSVAAAVEGLADLGVDGVLTSGGASRAVDGLAELGRASAAGRACGVEVVAGAGVRPDQVAALVGAGVQAVHLSARRPARAAGPAGVSRVSVGTADDGGHAVTDPALVAQVRAALDALP